jgi:uncharacterized membrane protein
VGLGLIAFPEFFYLLDGFSSRMNTIFKFYYQAWLLLSICASFAIIVVLDRLRGTWKKIAQAGIILTIMLILIYPVTATYYRFFVDHNEQMSLDGMYHIRTYNPLEAEAIDWLKQAPDGVVVEAVGDSYNANFAKVSTHSGLPTILGWPGHELQWRGGNTEIGNRAEDVRRIYQLRNWEEVKMLLDRYQVRYLYIGKVERSTYNVEETKLRSHLDVVFQNNDVVIYGYQPAVLVEPQ